jgi:hypothetical protein
MTNPKDQQREPDKLDLDVETVKDLEPDKESAEAVRGGWGNNSYTCVG